jgi:hypothetical protein
LFVSQRQSHHTSFVTSASLAETDCGLWGSTVASETLPFGAGQLASIQVAVELDPLAEIAQRDGAFAGWIGIGWSTGDPEQGEWVWVDGSDKGSIQAEFNWCAGSPPSPYSLFPFAVLNPDDPNQAAVIAADLPGKRLALVWAPDATEWCLGLPTDAVGPSVPWTEGAYTVDNAHMVCERPYLDPAAFVSKPAPADAPAPGVAAPVSPSSAFARPSSRMRSVMPAKMEICSSAMKRLPTLQPQMNLSLRKIPATSHSTACPACPMACAASRCVSAHRLGARR